MCPSTILNTFHMLTCLMYTVTQRGRYYYYCHLKDDKTNIQTDLVIHPKLSYRGLVVTQLEMREPRFDIRQVGSSGGVIYYCTILLL